MTHSVNGTVSFLFPREPHNGGEGTALHPGWKTPLMERPPSEDVGMPALSSQALWPSSLPWTAASWVRSVSPPSPTPSREGNITTPGRENHSCAGEGRGWGGTVRAGRLSYLPARSLASRSWAPGRDVGGPTYSSERSRRQVPQACSTHPPS